MRDLIGKLCIVVIKGGFVLVGTLEATEDALFVRLGGASTVRRWGTTKGLGELASRGPLTNTILDPEGNVVVNKVEVSRVIPCNETAWN